MFLQIELNRCSFHVNCVWPEYSYYILSARKMLTVLTIVEWAEATLVA